MKNQESEPTVETSPSTPVSRSGTTVETSPNLPVSSIGTPTPISSSNPIDPNQPSTQQTTLEEDDSNLKSRKKRQKSTVWEHFTEVVVGNKMKAKCKYCNKPLAGGRGSGTSHLRSHVKSYPRRHLVTFNQKYLTGNVSKSGKEELTSTTFDSKIARKELACLVVMHEHPLSLVDQINFKRFVCSLQPLFKVPSQNILKSDILGMYAKERSNLMELIEKNESRIAITSDMWTSNQKKGFMAITTHFINRNWKLQSRLLRFLYVPCPHNKEVLSEALLKALVKWKIDVKLSTITLDNCSTNDAMMVMVLDELKSRSLIANGSYLHMWCCAHILNLVVQDGLAVIKEGISAIRESVSYWTATPKRLQKFEGTFVGSNKPTKSLSLDCPTRWNSTFLMLETTLLYKDVFTRIRVTDTECRTECRTCPVVTELQWKFAKDICAKLKVFYEVTELFSGTLYPTINVYFSKICYMKLRLRDWLTSPTPIVAIMASEMMTKFVKYWDDVNVLMAVAAILDPQYKLKLIQFYYCKIYGVNYVVEVEKIKRVCYDMVREYSERGADATLDPSLTLLSMNSSQVSMTEYDMFVMESQTDYTPQAISELDLYLEKRVLPRIENFDILVWWKVQGVKYPTLKAIARDILAIPVSTVASESAFSTSGRVISPHRNKLHTRTIEALMCTRSWLWAAEQTGDGAACLDYHDTDTEDDDGTM